MYAEHSPGGRDPSLVTHSVPSMHTIIRASPSIMHFRKNKIPTASIFILKQIVLKTKVLMCQLSCEYKTGFSTQRYFFFIYWAPPHDVIKSCVALPGGQHEPPRLKRRLNSDTRDRENLLKCIYWVCAWLSWTELVFEGRVFMYMYACSAGTERVMFIYVVLCQLSWIQKWLLNTISF